LAGTAASAQTNYPTAIPGCIARWNFQSNGGTFTTVSDVSGNGRTGTPMNVSATAGYQNSPNTAALFNGANSYVQVSHNVALNPSAITVIALVKPTGFYSGACQGNNIIYKGFDYSQLGTWALLYDDQAFDQNCSSYNPNNNSMTWVGGSYSPIPPPQSYLTPNQWYLFVVTYGTDSVRRYQIPMNPLSHNPSITPFSVAHVYTPLGFSSDDIRIGATRNPPYPYWVNGVMDEIALYNRALTRAEVQTVYDSLWGFKPSAVPAVTGIQTGLFPTASDGRFTVSLQLPSTCTVSYDVVDATGRVLHQRSVAHVAGGASEQFDLRGSLASGTYFLRISAQGERTVQRFQITQ